MASTHSIKVHLFRVARIGNTEPLTDTLARIDSMSLADRIRPWRSRDFRLERLAVGGDIPEMAGMPDLRLFNIMNFRDGHGPGQAQVDAPLTGIDYDGGAPGEDTAVLYDPNTSCMAIQYAHNGPRHMAIQEYLCEFLPTGSIQLNVKLDEEYERKFRDQRSLQRVSVKVDTSQVSANDVSGNLAMASAYQAAENLNGTVLDITIAVDGRQRGASLNGAAKSLASFAKNLVARRPEAVKRLETKGPVDADSPEVIDLLGGKLVQEIGVAVDDADYRMDIEDRWNALFRVYSSWHRNGHTA